MEPQQPTNTPQSPAWHQLNYDPPPQVRPRTPRQQPQWHTSPPTLADVGYEFRRMGRGLRGIARGLPGIGQDIWTLGIKDGIHDTAVFLRHPPRWFFIALIASGIFVDMFFACSLSGVVREQAGYLRSLMP